jgi:L-asparaginase
MRDALSGRPPSIIGELMKHVTRGLTRAALTYLLCHFAPTVWAQDTNALPKVRVVATGGTIAGEQREPGTLGGYDIKKGVNEIVALIPNVQRYAQVETEQFSNVPSPAITPDHWLRLAQRINTIFKERPDLSGVVVTHGTARLEETAFFLYLTINSDRPVVVVGAQRPPTGISPDGPINLLSAIRVAAAPQSRGKGVTAVMDDRIMSARDVTKVYARGGGFEPAEMGMLGVVTANGIEFFYQPVRKHTVASDFDVATVKVLPRVGISYSYSGAQGTADPEATAVIVTTTGFAPGEEKYYQALRKKGVVVATTFPSGEHVADQSSSSDSTLPPVVAVKHLMPTKARILMMLALTKTQRPSEIQKIFDSY